MRGVQEIEDAKIYPVRALRRWLFALLLAGVFLLCLRAEAAVGTRPGEPLARAFSELFQDADRITRLEAGFLSVGLPRAAGARADFCGRICPRMILWSGLSRSTPWRR